MKNNFEEWINANPGFSKKGVVELEDRVNQWLYNIPEEVRSVLLELFFHSHFYSKTSILGYFVQKYNGLSNVEKNYTIFSAIESKEPRRNSSTAFLYEFAAEIDEINDYSIQQFGYVKSYMLDKAKLVVFMDDIIGTGETVINFLEQNLDKLKKVKIAIWCICITEFAKEQIIEFEKKEEVKSRDIIIDIQPLRVEKKAFQEGNIFKGSICKHNLNLIKEHENKLRKSSKFVLGYKDCQCLVSFYNDTPNNTLSSFWTRYRNDCNEENKPIFKRKKKKKSPWYTETKEDRKNCNINARVNAGNNIYEKKE